MTKMYRILGKKGRITIPFEIRTRVGFAYNDILSFTETDDGQTIIIKREKICNGCRSIDRDSCCDSVSLQDFLNSLTPQEQQAALIHLSVKWAEKKGEMTNGN